MTGPAERRAALQTRRQQIAADRERLRARMQKKRRQFADGIPQETAYMPKTALDAARGWMQPYPAMPATAPQFRQYAQLFANNLRRARGERKQSDIANQINAIYQAADQPARVSQRDVSRWEQGRHIPRKHLGALLAALGVSLADLLTEHNDLEP